jgi:hypothetical protein
LNCFELHNSYTVQFSRIINYCRLLTTFNMITSFIITVNYFSKNQSGFLSAYMP